MAELPETLNETYERSLRQINNADWEVAHRLLQCVAVAFHPLLVQQLAELVAFDFKARPTPTFCEDWREEDPVDAVLSTCSGFLHIVNVKGSLFVQFSHPSAKEFLTSTRLANASDENIRRYHVDMTSAHTVAAQVCLGILLHLEKNVTKDSIQRFPLAGYAARHWFDHARFENVSQTVESGAKQLFDASQPHFAIWAWIYDSGQYMLQSQRPLSPRGTPWHYAASIGLHDTIKLLANEHSQDVDSRGFNTESTPLLLASYGGHEEVVRVLLECGADVTAQDKDGETPLHWASLNGCVEVARILLERRVDATAKNRDGWTPLHMASEHGYVEIAQLLVEHGADPKAQNTYWSTHQRREGWTPLHSASQNGYVEFAQFLVEHGADPGAQNKHGWTPLHSALKNGHAELAQFLVERGADPTAQDEDGLTPLHFASENGQIEATRFLVEHGANLNAAAQGEGGVDSAA